MACCRTTYYGHTYYGHTYYGHTYYGRYGVLPGYGIAFQSGFQDTFTATATAALEYGAFPYARGVIDNWLRY